ncbi:uncharacterized protein MKZ38_006922 [Zalerion maritima]|uniref:Cyclin-like f-box protein n=1 Tax=Zalerion maritima TaxID=339359 RepID=A0AAD5WUC9_9PEZI|nr:uncharacterized protein MKZ38_006922 [Zalerion maritima]
MLSKSIILLSLAALTAAAPQRNGGGNQKTAQEQAADIPGGISEATDGSVIMDTTVNVNGLDIRFKISGPADQFTSMSGVPGAAGVTARAISPGSFANSTINGTTDGITNGTTNGANNGTAETNGTATVAATMGTLGLNVLLHGDGGQSFFDFPNQGVRANLAGVAVLAPDENLFWGGGQGLDRTNGVEHAQAVNDLVRTVLPQMMTFNESNVFFTGVSGGSLLLSGFFVPAHGADYVAAASVVDGNNTTQAAADATTGKEGGFLLNCGGMPPQVELQNAAALGSGMRVHWQSTQQELDLLQGQDAIPGAVKAYEQIATDAGLSEAEVNALQTVDNSPNGGHCEFDEQDFVSGVQLMADSYMDVMQEGGSGMVNGIGNVKSGVVGNEALQFA